jgi:hypothetical protein
VGKERRRVGQVVGLEEVVVERASGLGRSRGVHTPDTGALTPPAGAVV